MQDVQNRILEEAKAAVVFPAQIKILDGMVFNMRDPIIVGVEVVKGFLKVGTPLCAIEEGGVVCATFLLSLSSSPPLLTLVVCILIFEKVSCFVCLALHFHLVVVHSFSPFWMHYFSLVCRPFR